MMAYTDFLSERNTTWCQRKPYVTMKTQNTLCIQIMNGGCVLTQPVRPLCSGHPTSTANPRPPTPPLTPLPPTPRPMLTSPQGLCTCCSLCQEYSHPDSHLVCSLTFLRPLCSSPVQEAFWSLPERLQPHPLSPCRPRCACHPASSS